MHALQWLMIGAFVFLVGCRKEDHVQVIPITDKGREFLEANGTLDKNRSMSPDQVFPRVVHRQYIEVAMTAAGTKSIDDKYPDFGFVRWLGNDLCCFLACRGDKNVRNLHQEDLDRLGLDEDAAWELAKANTRRIAFDGKAIVQQVTKTENGNDWAIWLGDDFTSSCAIIPELYRWSSNALPGNTFLVRIASTRLILILQQKNQEMIPHFDHFLDNVLKDDDHRVSQDWFLLTESVLTPLRPEEQSE